MNIITRRIISTMFGIGILGTAGFFIVKEENIKRQNKVIALEAQYLQQYKSLEEYKVTYKQEINQIKADNFKKMQETKAQYDNLLASQASLIKNNTKVVAQSYTPTTTTQVKVTKPKSTSTQSS